MAEGAEDLKTGEWLTTQIEGATTLEAFMDVIPSDADLPAVKYSVQFAGDLRGATRGTQRILTQIDWLIVIVSKGLGISALLPDLVAIDAALHEQTGTTAEVSVQSCVRLEPFTLADQGDDQQWYRQVGGIYRTMVKTL